MPDLIGYISRIKKELDKIFGSIFINCPKMTGNRHPKAQPKNPEKTNLKKLDSSFRIRSTQSDDKKSFLCHILNVIVTELLLSLVKTSAASAGV